MSLVMLHPSTSVMVRQATPACADDPLFAALDFWVGGWSVWSGDQQVGTNRIAKILEGCAIVEEWRSAARFVDTRTPERREMSFLRFDLRRTSWRGHARRNRR